MDDLVADEVIQRQFQEVPLVVGATIRIEVDGPREHAVFRQPIRKPRAAGSELDGA